MVNLIETETIRLGRQAFADELVECETLQHLQAPTKFVGRNEVGEMVSKLLVVVTVKALDGRVLNGAVMRWTCALVQVCFGQVVL